jgi:hypothetical protein
MKQYHDSITVIHSANNKPIIRINQFEQHNNTSYVEYKTSVLFVCAQAPRPPSNMLQIGKLSFERRGKEWLVWG